MENLKLDIVLKDTPIEYGLDRESIVELYDKLGDSSIEVYPIEIPAQYHECSAMGFIIVDAADQLDYDYETSGLNKFIAEILDDVDRENPDHIYQFGKLNICLGR